MPRIGEKKNCISAHVVTNSPIYSDERAMLPFKNSEISFGRIGTMIPNASMSSRTVTNINPSAACRLLSISVLLSPRNRVQRAPSNQSAKVHSRAHSRTLARCTIIQQDPPGKYVQWHLYFLHRFRKSPCKSGNRETVRNAVRQRPEAISQLHR